jgi:predicted TIM-barrel fold metal-dependent hydrolase
MIIDAHAHHTTPPELGNYRHILLASRGTHGRGRSGITEEKVAAALNEPVFGGKSHLGQMEEVGTDLQLISPRPFTLMHSEKPERIVQWYVQECNNVTAMQVKLFPNRFRGVAGLPQVAGIGPGNSVEELERCVKELGFVGCLVDPDPNEGEGDPPPGLGDEYWYPLYEKLVELDVPALIHTASSKNLRDPYTLHFVTEENIAIYSLLHSRVFEDFPRLKLVVSHGGGAIPYQAGRFMASQYREGQGRERFEDAIRRLWFDGCLYTKEALELLIKVVGADRVLFGTERPGTGTAKHPETGRWMDDTKPLIDDMDWLSAADKKKIFEDNARQIYKLDV